MYIKLILLCIKKMSLGRYEEMYSDAVYLHSYINRMAALNNIRLVPVKISYEELKVIFEHPEDLNKNNKPITNIKFCRFNNKCIYRTSPSPTTGKVCQFVHDE